MTKAQPVLPIIGLVRTAPPGLATSREQIAAASIVAVSHSFHI